MKNNYFLLNFFLSSGLIVLLILSNMPLVSAHLARSLSSSASIPANQTSTTCDTGRSVQVSGTAVVNVIPDRAIIQLGVQSNATSVKAVENSNTITIRQIIQAIRSAGVQPSDISTDRYIIEPIYDDYNSLYIKGYRINNQVAVNLRNVSQVSVVISAALQAGANQVVDVEFYTSELRKYRDQARQLAVEAAAQKAHALASAAGAETDCVISISENTWSYYSGAWYGRNQNMWMQNTVQNLAPGMTAPAGNEQEPVSLGHISVRAEVGITYSLK